MNEKRPSTRKGSSIIIYLLIIFLVYLLARSFMPNILGTTSPKEVTLTEFETMLQQEKVTEVVIDRNNLRINFKAVANKDDKDPTDYYTGYMVDDGERISDVVRSAKNPEGKAVSFSQKIIEDNTIWNLLLTFLPMIGLGILMVFLFRYMSNKMNGENMSFGKSNAKMYMNSKTGVTFADVAGQDEAKEDLQEIVDFLHNPAKYKAVGAIMPKGALLVGPPGTGKTLLAKAVAGEAGVPFFSIAGSAFVEMFVGRGAARVRDLFKEANDKAPCIVFIDELDTIGKKRDGGLGTGSNDEREQTLNQLLSEMDGFDGGSGVVILAATNRPEVLDSALLRPGRFDRRIPVELPDLKGRKAILKVHAKKIVLDEANIDYNYLARLTSGTSGADLANIINEGALRAVKYNRRVVTQEDLVESIETVIAGQQRKNKVISVREKRTVAYHEIGHALVSLRQKHTAPVTKITIIPRTSGALGYTMQADEEETNLVSREELNSRLATIAGGRSAEEVVFNSITTGASNDIEQMTKIARAMITRYGMNDEFDMMALEVQVGQYLATGESNLICGPETAAKIDVEVLNLIKKAHQKAKDILVENRILLDRLAEYLLEKESINGEDFMDFVKKYDEGLPMGNMATVKPEEASTNEKPASTDMPAPPTPEIYGSDILSK